MNPHVRADLADTEAWLLLSEEDQSSRFYTTAVEFLAATNPGEMVKAITYRAAILANQGQLEIAKTLIAQAQ